jgi:hypothetical protein
MEPTFVFVGLSVAIGILTLSIIQEDMNDE